MKVNNENMKEEKRNVQKYLKNKNIVQKMNFGYMGSVVYEFVLVYRDVKVIYDSCT